MKMKRNLFVALTASVGIFSAYAAETIHEDMRHNFESLMQLQPYVVDPSRFQSNDNEEEIKERLKVLSHSAERLPSLVEKTKPNLSGIASIFSDYVSQTQKNFESGHKDYARNQLRTIVGFCAACHTRSGFVAEFADPKNQIEKSKLPRLQKAEYLVATRQFDKAILVFNEVIESPVESEAEWREFIAAVRSFLGVAVRVKEDPKLALNFVNKVSKIKSVSQFYSRDFKEWEKNLKEWSKEPKVKTSSSVELLKKSKRLIERAKKQQLYPADHASDILFLRATNDLHEAIEIGLNKKDKAEAYYSLAQAYSALSEPLLWELDSLYLEACVKEVPHTEMAQTCFRKLSSSIYIGFSGSGGVNIPVDQVERLSRLRKLAF